MARRPSGAVRWASELGSGLDGFAEPVRVRLFGVDVAEEVFAVGGHSERVGEQEGVQLAWDVLARLDDEAASRVGRDDGLRRLSLLGAWGEGQLLAAAEAELGEGCQLPELRRQLLQRAAAEVEVGEG